MKELISKLSTYDYFAMWLPGWLLINEIAYLLCGKSIISWQSEFFFVIGAYAVGIVLHCCMETIWEWCGLRNCPKMIRKVFDESYIHNNSFRKKSLIITYAPKTNPNKCELEQKKSVLAQYYFAYSIVCKDIRYYETIKTIERQIAFVRSMLIPILLSSAVIYQYIDISQLISCIFFIGIIGVSILSCLVLIRKQKSIYRCVFENYEFCDRE